MQVEFHNHILTIDRGDTEFTAWMNALKELTEIGLIRTTQLIRTVGQFKTKTNKLPSNLFPDRVQFNTIYQAFLLIKDSVLLSVHFIDSKLATTQNLQLFEQFTLLYKQCVDKWSLTNPEVSSFKKLEQGLCEYD